MSVVDPPARPACSIRQPELPARTGERNAALDGVRGVAILSVLGFHLFTAEGVHPYLEAVPLIPALLHYGWVGVSLFFALSGYLITQKLVADRGRAGYFSGFLIKRGTRLLPAYALLLLAMPAASLMWGEARHGHVFNDLIPRWSHLLFIQNEFIAATGYLGNHWLRVTWSLAIEVQFYALAVVLIHLVSPRRLGFALVMLVVVALASRYAMFLYAANPAASLMVRTVCRIDGFALGGIVALAASRTGPRPAYLTWAAFLTCSALFVAFGCGAFGRITAPLVPAYYVFLAGASAALVALSAQASFLTRLLSWSFFQSAGRFSYFLYLFHLPVLWIVFELLMRHEPESRTSAGLALCVIAGVVTWLLAILSFRYLEQPAIRLGQAWSAKFTARLAAPGAGHAG